MKKKILTPEQIIVPGEYELGDESILKVYFRVFERGHGEDLPPVIVVKKSLDQRLVEELKPLDDCQMVNLPWYGPSGTKAAKYALEEVERLYNRFHQQTKGASHYLIDGNHRTAAAALTHNPIHALEIEKDEDLEEIKRMVKRGELFNFYRNDDSLSKLVNSFEVYCLGHLDNTKTIKERIDELTSNEDLPQYMRERYQRV